jgi:hypothetical protein
MISCLFDDFPSLLFHLFSPSRRSVWIRIGIGTAKCDPLINSSKVSLTCLSLFLCLSLSLVSLSVSLSLPFMTLSLSLMIGVSQMVPDDGNFVMIWDMQNLGWNNVDYSLLKFAIDLLQNYYPEVCAGR